MRKSIMNFIKEKLILSELKRQFYISMRDVFAKEAEKKDAEKKELKNDNAKETQFESNTPISTDEFKQKLESIIQTYRKFLEYRKQENLFLCSLGADFVGFINQTKFSKSENNLSEILDKTENTISDEKNIKNTVNRLNHITRADDKQRHTIFYIPFEEVKQKER